ncbi:MAG: hypothetical protein ABI382_13500 [Nakamurella sp.]
MRHDTKTGAAGFYTFARGFMPTYVPTYIPTYMPTVRRLSPVAENGWGLPDQPGMLPHLPHRRATRRPRQGRLRPLGPAVSERLDDLTGR